MKMKYLIIILALGFLFLFILNYLNISIKKSAFDIVNDMGIGYNLGYSFDSYDPLEQIQNPNEQITLLGNPIPTKQTIKKIKQNGFKTIRFPVTWSNFMDDFGKINSEWLSRVKEVVNWINEYNMYCILNLYHDGDSPNWLSEGIDAKDKFINFWVQIADEFKDYNELLIFESMNNVHYYTLYYYQYVFDYKLFLNFSQAFVDIIRNSGGKNKERLLIISGVHNDLEGTCTKNYLIPKDLYNKFAISINYYFPSGFTSCEYDISWNYQEKWGNDAQYNELIENFELMKTFFIDKKIPIIISEVGVLTEEKKSEESIREFLYAVFSLSTELNGFMACLWDTSNKIMGNMNYYNRETNEWYDEKIKKIFFNISKGKYTKSKDYFIMSNIQIISAIDNYGDLVLKLGNKKSNKIIVNVKILGKRFEQNDFNAFCYDYNHEYMEIGIRKENEKKQYDGTSIFTIDIKNKDCRDLIQIEKDFFNDYIILNNLTVVFEEKFRYFDYKSYKSAILNNIN